MAGTAAAAPYGDVLAHAIALLSGPTGRVAWLRRAVTGIPLSAVSLPLDIPAAIDTIPLHLRRAVRKRDRHCRFPGCDMPAAGCEVHHITPRKDGGRHALWNLTLLCRLCRRRHNRHYAKHCTPTRHLPRPERTGPYT
jgi:HNH endonuclease